MDTPMISENEWDEETSNEEDSDESYASEIFEHLVGKRRHNCTSPNDQNLKKLKSHAKNPTLDEINQLKETRNLYHSNLFRLQIEEMLKEIQVKGDFKEYIEVWLKFVNQFLSSLKDHEKDKNQMEWLEESQVKVPFNLKHFKISNPKEFKFYFIKPKRDVYYIGASATRTLTNFKIIADICIPMPEECFQKEDYLNLVYDQKRALYLTYITNELLKLKFYETALSDKSFKFNFYENNALKPVLEISQFPQLKCPSDKFVIRIFVAGEKKCFKLSRFVPINNNVRLNLINEQGDDSTLFPTPNYNANVLFDLTMHDNQAMLKTVFEKRHSFQEALQLLKVWLRQRDLSTGYSGFNSHIMAMFMAYLCKERKLLDTMSSYQVVRTVWNHLYLSEWDKEAMGISLYAPENPVPGQPSLQNFHDKYDVVFVDITGYYNICSNLSRNIYRQVCHEASKAVALLNNSKLNSFKYLFMEKCSLYMQFDNVLKISREDSIRQMLSFVDKGLKVNYIGNTYPQLLHLITNILSGGLGDRVNTILPFQVPSTPWVVKKSIPKPVQYIHLGIILNLENAMRIIDKGPETYTEGAEEFRKFWGYKAELRRFQDNSVIESVVWGTSNDTFAKKRLVVRNIVIHLLNHHLNVQKNNLHYIGGELDVVYKITPLFKVEKVIQRFKYVDGKDDAHALSYLAISAFDNLKSKLLAIDDFPLEIVAVTGISPIFRYCEPTPLLPRAYVIQKQLYASHVLQTIVQLGVSGNWPNELKAMHSLIAAIYIKISKYLRQKCKLFCQVTINGVLVLSGGYCFNLEIAHPKIVALMKKQKNENGVIVNVDNPQSIQLEKRQFIMPKVSGALHALAQQYPNYGAGVMIAKHWLFSQLIDNGIWPDKCTELLMAVQFLNKTAHDITCSPQIAFIRFLYLLSNTECNVEFFLLNFNELISEEEILKLEDKFYSDRQSFPHLCIVTSYDQTHRGTLWTSTTRPSINVLARVTMLARKVLDLYASTIVDLDSSPLDVSTMFSASNHGYDLVIQLKPDLVSSSMSSIYNSTFAAYSSENWKLPLAGSNFLCEAVKKLREAYNDYAAFFYNPCGGKEIAVLWKPNVFIEKEFKVGEVNACVPKSKSKLICYKEAIISDFKFILKDFYLRVGPVDFVWKSSYVCNPYLDPSKHS